MRVTDKEDSEKKRIEHRFELRKEKKKHHKLPEDKNYH